MLYRAVRLSICDWVDLSVNCNETECLCMLQGSQVEIMLTLPNRATMHFDLQIASVAVAINCFSGYKTLYNILNS